MVKEGHLPPVNFKMSENWKYFSVG